MVRFLKQFFFRSVIITSFLIFNWCLNLEISSGESPSEPLDPSSSSSTAQEEPPLQEPLPPPQPPPQQPLQQRVGFFQSLNPDMRVEVNFIGNKTFNGGENGENGDENGEGNGEEDDNDLDLIRDRFTLKEVELGFQASVDPYARADVFFSGEDLFGGESEVEIEEGFLTLLRLPLRAQVKIGKFRSSFGEINDGDPEDEFPYADRPLVLVNFFGEEGHVETGINSNFVIPNPWDVPMLLWFGVFNGDNDIAFHGGEARKPIYFTRYELFAELGPATGFEIGTAFITGYNDKEGEFRTTMENVHVELEWQDPLYSQYKSFTWVGELYLSQREGIEGTEDSFGLYTYAQYQVSRRWFITGRYDYSQLPEDSDSHEWLAGGAITFQPSRFSRFRVQYDHVESNFEESRDELFFQMLFIIGFERPEPF